MEIRVGKGGVIKGVANGDDNKFQGIDGAMGPVGPDLGGSSAHGDLVTWGEELEVRQRTQCTDSHE